MHEGPHAKGEGGLICLRSRSFFALLVLLLLERPGQSVCVRLMGSARGHTRTHIHTHTGNDKNNRVGLGAGEEGGEHRMTMMMRVSWPPGSRVARYRFVLGTCQRWDEGGGGVAVGGVTCPSAWMPVSCLICHRGGVGGRKGKNAGRYYGGHVVRMDGKGPGREWRPSSWNVSCCCYCCVTAT